MGKIKYRIAAKSGRERVWCCVSLLLEDERHSALVFLWLFIFFILHSGANAQRQGANIYTLSINEAVRFAKIQNKWVQAANIGQDAYAEDRRDVYRQAFPMINVSSSYQRFSGLTLFADGLRDASTGPRKPSPNAASFGVEGLYNIYGGGKQLALRLEQTSRLKLANVNAQEVSGNIGLQTAMQYFDLLKLNELKKFALDQRKRAETRVNSINSLYKNQKVTRSDVLRAEVNLSNVELALQQNENDIILANRKLGVLLNIPDSLSISPADSASMPKPALDILLPMIEHAGLSSYTVQMAMTNLEVQRARLAGIKSGNRPTLAFYGAYGLNYPNYLFFPPVDQAYAIGFVGIKVQYNISSLYQNRSKVEAGKLRLKELEVLQNAYQDNVQTEVLGYFIRYGEALTRISVNERSVLQAQANYRIIDMKYLSQLSLLTDLLDADNLYQESRLNLVKAQTDALGIYYHILYSTGNL